MKMWKVKSGSSKIKKVNENSITKVLDKMDEGVKYAFFTTRNAAVDYVLKNPKTAIVNCQFCREVRSWS